MILVALESSVLLDQLSASFDIPLIIPKIIRFSDGELSVDLSEYVSQIIDKHAIVVLSGIYEMRYQEYSMLIDQLRLYGVHTITGYIPYLRYARNMVNKDGSRASAAKTIRLLEALPCDRFICFELHDSRIVTLFKKPIMHLRLHDIIAPLLQHYDPSNTLMVTPDFGGLARVQALAHDAHIQSIAYEKKRINGECMVELQGNFPPAIDTAIIVDDIIDTGATIDAVVYDLKKRGIKTIHLYAAHGIFSSGSHLASIDCCYIINNLNNSMLSPAIRLLDHALVWPYMKRMLI